MLQNKMFPEFYGTFAKLLESNRRFTVKAYVDVKDGVLNGDPENSGNQRINPYTGHAYATDVSFKRIIRDNFLILTSNGYEVKKTKDDKYDYTELYIAHRGVLNANNEGIYKDCGIEPYQKSSIGVPEALAPKVVTDGIPCEMPNPAYTMYPDGDKWMLTFDGSLDTADRATAKAAFVAIDKGFGKLVEKLHKGSKIGTLDDKKLTTLNTRLADKYIDVRQFGAVASTGDSCGNVKGPWQVGYGHSIEQLEPVRSTISRVAITRITDKELKRSDLGQKVVTEYALYEFELTFVPTLARRVGSHGLTSEDMRLFWTSLYNFGRFSGSAMRGHIELAGVYVFAHDSAIGNDHDHALYNRITAAKRENVASPRKFEDYVISVDDSNMTPGVELVKFFERGPKNTTPPGSQPPKLK